MQAPIRILFLSYNNPSIVEQVVSTLKQCTDIPITQTRRIYDIIYTLEHIDKSQIFIMTEVDPDCIKCIADILKHQYPYTVHSYWLNFDHTNNYQLANANLKDVDQQTLTMFIQ